MKNLFNLIFLISFAVAPVFAQTSTNDEEVEEVVVVGTLASLISAIEKQRKSNSIVSVVDSDALGDFPDTTAAEAIRRLSGISVENDQGEGRYVSIRGMSGDLNSIAVNGALIPAPEGGRKVMLDGLPTELLDSIEVYKSLTPDMDADAIGGRIEFNTKRASTLKEKLLKFKLDTSYNEQSKNSDNPKFSLTYGNKINDTMGHILGITYASKQIVTYNNETGFPGWEIEDGNKTLGDDWEMRYYDLTRERFGLTYDFDAVVGDDTVLYANVLINEYTDDELRYKDEYGKLKFSEINESSANISQIRRDAETRKRIEVRKIETYILGLETDLGGWFTEAQFSHSFAEQDDTDNVDVKFRSDKLSCDPCGTFFYNNSQKVGILFTPAGQSLWDTGIGIDAFEEEDDLIQDTEVAFKIDFTKDGFTVLDRPTEVKFGFKYSSREKERDNEYFEWDDETVPQDQAYFGARIPFKWPFAGQSMGPMADASLLYPLQGSFGPYIRGQLKKDYTTEEDIFALYVMGTLEYENAIVTAGVRYEDTSFSTVGYNEADNFAKVNADKDYSFFAPSFNLKYYVSDDLIVRAAITRSLARPGFSESNTVSEFEREDDNLFKGSMGNPDLDPYESNNYDLSLEYYGETRSASIGYFKKDIENAIYPLVTSGVFNNINFSELETFVNTGDSDVSGFEINFFNEFTLLPEPFDGLFISANLTLTDGESTLETDNGNVTFPFRKLSETSKNISVGYNKNKIDARLSYVSRSPYLDYLADEGDSASVQEDLSVSNIRYTDDHAQLDFNIKYKYTDNLSIKFEISNITDEPEFYYWGFSDRLSQYDEYGTTYSVGIRYNL